jgi:hypothetical protein
MDPERYLLLGTCLVTACLGDPPPPPGDTDGSASATTSVDTTMSTSSTASSTMTTATDTSSSSSSSGDTGTTTAGPSGTWGELNLPESCVIQGGDAREFVVGARGALTCSLYTEGVGNGTVPPGVEFDTSTCAVDNDVVSEHSGVWAFAALVEDEADQQWIVPMCAHKEIGSAGDYSIWVTDDRGELLHEVAAQYHYPGEQYPLWLPISKITVNVEHTPACEWQMGERDGVHSVCKSGFAPEGDYAPFVQSDFALYEEANAEPAGIRFQIGVASLDIPAPLDGRPVIVSFQAGVCLEPFASDPTACDNVWADGQSVQVSFVLFPS